MEKSKTSNRYSPEMRARAVRMVLEHQGSYETQSAAVAAIAPQDWLHPRDIKGLGSAGGKGQRGTGRCDQC